MKKRPKKKLDPEYGGLQVEKEVKKIQALRDRWCTPLGQEVQAIFLEYLSTDSDKSQSERWEKQAPIWLELPYWQETPSQIDFRGIDLSGQLLENIKSTIGLGIDFSYATLNNCQLKNCSLWGTLAYGASFDYASFEKVSLTTCLFECSFRHSSFKDVRISSTDSTIESSDFSGSTFIDCEFDIYVRRSLFGKINAYGFWDIIDFSKANIENSYLVFDNGAIPDAIDATFESYTNRHKTVNHHGQMVSLEELYATHPRLKNYQHYIKHTNLDFTNTQITDSKLRFLKGKWKQLLFQEATLKNIDWQGADAKDTLTDIVEYPGRLFGLLGVDFTGAHFINNNLQYMYLQNASFKHAQLEKTDFKHSKLDGVDFTGAKFKGVKGIPLKTKWFGK